MIPMLMVNNQTNRSSANFELFGNLFLLKLSRLPKVSDFMDFPVCKFCHWISLPFYAWFSALKRAIRLIVRIGAKEKMSRIAASRIIAFVTNIESLSGLTIKETEGHLVRSNWLTHKSNRSVSSFRFWRHFKWPAFIGSATVNFFPEMIGIVFVVGF